MTVLYRIEPKGDFFELTLTVENEREATLVHDDIACSIATSGQFIGDVFNASLDCKLPKSGTVPLPDRRKCSKEALEAFRKVMDACDDLSKEESVKVLEAAKAGLELL